MVIVGYVMMWIGGIGAVLGLIIASLRQSSDLRRSDIELYIWLRISAIASYIFFVGYFMSHPSWWSIPFMIILFFSLWIFLVLAAGLLLSQGEVLNLLDPIKRHPRKTLKGGNENVHR